MTELKKRAQSLCEQKDLEGDKKHEVQQTVKDTEQQWRTLLQAAEDTQRCRRLISLHINVTATDELPDPGSMCICSLYSLKFEC